MSSEDPIAFVAQQLGEYLRWEHALGGIGLPVVPDAVVADAAVSNEAVALDIAQESKSDEVQGADRPGLASVSDDDLDTQLRVLNEQIAACQACVLHKQRTQTVVSRGNPQARLVFVGEGPGYNEDKQGLPFVGPAGVLLDKMVKAMGFAGDEVYICNVVKCRPPENRTPLPEEMSTCAWFLERQLKLVAPEIIVALGRCAATGLGCAEPQGGRWRGQWKSWQGIPVMSTYHPAFLLRSPENKRLVWDDLQQVMAKLKS